MAEDNPAAQDAAPAVTKPNQMASLMPPEGRSPKISPTELIQSLPDTPSRDDLVRRIVDAEMSQQQLKQDWQLCYQMAESGQLADIKGLPLRQAIAVLMLKLQFGRSLGINPGDSIRHIYLVNGRPSIENDIIASRLYRKGLRWHPVWQYVTEDDHGKKVQRCVGCTLYLFWWNEAEKKPIPMLGPDGEQVTESFTEDDAARITVKEFGREMKLHEKSNYRQYAKNMYYWRCIANVRRFYAPDVMHGASLAEERYDVQPPIDVEPISPEDELAPVAAEAVAEQQSLKDQLLKQVTLLEREEKP